MARQKKATTPPRQPDPSRVLQLGHIEDVRLFESHLKLYRVPPINSRFTATLGITANTEYDLGDHYFVVSVDYLAYIRTAKSVVDGQEADSTADDEDYEHNDGEIEAAAFENEPDALAKISFTFAGLYSIDEVDNEDPLSMDEVDAFAQTFGLSHTYSYAREYLQSVTTRIGLPALTIPLYRIPPP